MKIGDYITTTIRGIPTGGFIIAIHPCGTIDIEVTGASGACFRLSGLSIK